MCASVHQAVKFSTGQKAVMLCSWENKHRSGVALGMRHRPSGLYTYRLNDFREKNKHTTYAPCGVWHLYLTPF